MVEMIDYSKSHDWMSDNRYIKEFVNSVELSKEDYVLDAGCGSGYVAAIIRQEVKDLLQIDHDWAMLSKNNVAKHTETLKADLTNIWMVGEKTFDKIFCRSVFHRLKNPENAYREFERIIKKDGKLIITVSDVPENLFQEYQKMMSNKGERLYLTKKQWKDFFEKSKKFRIKEERRIFFDLNLHVWGLLEEHQNASKEFREHFKLKEGIIECSHACFILQKI